MRVSDSLVVKLLKATGSFTDEQLQALANQEKSEKKPLQDVVVSSNTLTEKGANAAVRRRNRCSLC